MDDKEGFAASNPTANINADKLIKKLKDSLHQSPGTLGHGQLHTKAGWIRSANGDMYDSGGAQQSRALLFAALHASGPDKDNPGLLSSAHDASLQTLDPTVWKDFSTIEHVRPQNPENKQSWESESPDNDIKLHSLGNLTILPSGTNSALGNKDWDFKRTCFKIMATPDLAARKRLQEDFEATSGHTIPPKYVEGEYMPFGKSLGKVDKWTVELMQQRELNILERAWDRLAPWMGIDETPT